MMSGRDFATFDMEFAKAVDQRLHRQQAAGFERVDYSQRLSLNGDPMTDQGRIGG
jgi:hypothetical protein